MEHSSLLGQTIFGYTVTEKIGAGAYGTVYRLIKENVSGRYVRALKHMIIPTEKQYRAVLDSMGGDTAKAENYFDEMLRSIVREIRILNELSEKGVPNIVRYYEHDIRTTGSPRRHEIFILMEYLTPFGMYAKSRSLSVRDVTQLAFELLDGLRACHENGVIHRDIKDDNIFVTGDGRYRLGDFGVAKILRDETLAETLTGTPDYLAPEVFHGNGGYTASVDLYSLGIVLYRLLNRGRNPFLPAYPAQYYSQDEIRAFSERMAGKLPPPPLLGGTAIGSVIVTAISGSDARYRSAAAFRAALEDAVRRTDPALLDEPVRAVSAAAPRSGESGPADDLRKTMPAEGKRPADGQSGAPSLTPVSRNEKRDGKRKTQSIRAEEERGPGKGRNRLLLPAICILIPVLCLGILFALFRSGPETDPGASAKNDSAEAVVTEKTAADKCPFEIRETGFSVGADNHYLYCSVLVYNPGDTAVSNAAFRITAKSASGDILGTGTDYCPLLYPQEELAVLSTPFTVSETPAGLEISPLEKNYVFKSEIELEHPVYLPLEIRNFAEFDDRYTGEVYNPNDYTIDDYAVLLLYRDADGKLLGGDYEYAYSEIRPGETVPFMIGDKKDFATGNCEVYAERWRD